MRRMPLPRNVIAKTASLADARAVNLKRNLRHRLLMPFKVCDASTLLPARKDTVIASTPSP